MIAKHNLIITFPVTEQQQNMLKSFYLDKTNCESTITVAQNIGNEYVLFLSILVKEPNFRFGIYSRDTGRLVHDCSLSDEILIVR